MASTSSRARASYGAKTLRPCGVRRSRLRRPSEGQAVRAISRAVSNFQVGRRQVVAVGELVQDAHLGQRVRAVEPVIAEGADAARVEAVEGADGVGLRHAAYCQLII